MLVHVADFGFCSSLTLVVVKSLQGRAPASLARAVGEACNRGRSGRDPDRHRLSRAAASGDRVCMWRSPSLAQPRLPPPGRKKTLCGEAENTAAEKCFPDRGLCGQTKTALAHRTSRTCHPSCLHLSSPVFLLQRSSGIPGPTASGERTRKKRLGFNFYARQHLCSDAA